MPLPLPDSFARVAKEMAQATWDDWDDWDERPAVVYDPKLAVSDLKLFIPGIKQNLTQSFVEKYSKGPRQRTKYV